MNLNMNKEKALTEKLKSGLRQHEVMRDHTTIKVGGVADFYFEAKTTDDLIKAVNAATQAKVPYFILGGGSNVIFSDYGFPGLVIKNAATNIAFMMEKSQAIVDSGASTQKVILEMISRNLSGLEFLFGVPGTIGGAVYGNAGAYGQSVSDYVKSATLLIPGADGESGEIVQNESDWFEFKYRSSKLKRMQGFKKPVILSVKLQLSQSRQEETMRRLNISKNKRIESQPIGQSAGCIFKNSVPPELQDVSGRGSRNMPELPKERTAGYLLDKSGVKKMRVGGARVSPKHANFILNVQGARAQDIRKLAEEMRSAVKEKFNITLEEEIEYVGQW